MQKNSTRAHQRHHPIMGRQYQHHDNYRKRAEERIEEQRLQVPLYIIHIINVNTCTRPHVCVPCIAGRGKSHQSRML